jgi:hypothetical protein
MAKTFKRPPRPTQPTDDAIAAFEAGGAGHDTKADVPNTHISTNVGEAVRSKVSRKKKVAAAPVPAPVAVSESIKRLSIDLPRSVHLRFKTACSAADTKMVREVFEFIERRTAELEKESGMTSHSHNPT